MSVKDKLVEGTKAIARQAIPGRGKGKAKPSAGTPKSKKSAAPKLGESGVAIPKGSSRENEQRKALSDKADALQNIRSMGVRDSLRDEPIVLPALRSEVQAEQAQERVRKLNYDQAKERFEASRAAREDQNRVLRAAAENAQEAEDEVFVVTNPEDSYLEIGYGGVSYYVGPGDTEIEPLLPGHTSEGVANFIAGSIAGLTAAKKQSKVRSAGEEDAVPLPGSVISGVADHIAAQLQGVENPPAHERLQPQPMPDDTEHYDSETLAAMQEAHRKQLQGKTAEGEEYQRRLSASRSKAAAPAKRSGAKRRLAEEK